MGFRRRLVAGPREVRRSRRDFLAYDFPFSTGAFAADGTGVRLTRWFGLINPKGGG